MNRSVLFLSLLSFAMACSKVEKVEKSMSDLRTQTIKAGESADEVKEIASEGFQQTRSKEAEATRSEKFRLLSSDKESFGGKIAAAAVYFKTMEFQLLTSNKFDDHLRDMLYVEAVNEFTQLITDIHKKIKIKKMSPLNDGKKHSNEQAFYALAATMHLNHHFQESLVRKNKEIKLTSFYDLVKRALVKDERGEHLAEHELLLVSGKNKEIMQDLLKARVDMVSALALKNLTDKKNMTLGQKAKALLFKITSDALGSINLPEIYGEINDATKNQTITFLEGALKTKKFLAHININVELEKTLRSAFSKVDLTDAAKSRNQVHADVGVDLDFKRSQIKHLIVDLML
jgi:hypothetical protein